MLNRHPVISLRLQLVKVSVLGKKGKFYCQKEGMAMGNSLSLVVSNIFMEHSEETALDIADHKPTRLQQCLHHLNSVRPTIKFTSEVEANDTLPFLEVLVMKRGLKLAMKVYQKYTHTVC
jgi:hypothetical protein